MQWMLDQAPTGEVLVYFDRKLRLRANDLDEAKAYVAGEGLWGSDCPVILQEPDGYASDITKELRRIRPSRRR